MAHVTSRCAGPGCGAVLGQVRPGAGLGEPGGMGEGPAALRTPAPHRPTPSLFAYQPPPPAASGKAVHSEGWETQAQKGRVSPLRDPNTPGDLPACRQSASSGLRGAAHPAPLSSQAAKGKAPPRGHFPFEEPQVEGGVGPGRSWFLSDSGLRFPASWAPPTPSLELPACRGASVYPASQQSALNAFPVSP